MALFDVCFGIGLDAERRRDAVIALCAAVAFLVGIAGASALHRGSDSGFLFMPVGAAFALLLWLHDYTHAEELELKRKLRRKLENGAPMARPEVRKSE